MQYVFLSNESTIRAGDESWLSFGNRIYTWNVVSDEMVGRLVGDLQDVYGSGLILRRPASIFEYGILGPKDEIASGDEIVAKLLPGGKEVEGVGFCWKEVDVVCPDMIGLCYEEVWDVEVLIRRKTFKS